MYMKEVKVKAKVTPNSPSMPKTSMLIVKDQISKSYNNTYISAKSDYSKGITDRRLSIL